MTKEDYEFLENTLRDLSRFLRERQEDEPWKIEERQKAQKRRLFYVVGSLSPAEERARELERKNLLSQPEKTPAFAEPPRRCAGPNVDLQLNSEKEKLGITEIFTEKEIKNMPKLKELSYRLKRDDMIHEFRYRRNGIDKSFSSKNYKEAKRKALEFCRQLNNQESYILDKDIPFNTFAIDYMQNVKKRTVTAKTFLNDYNRFENYILPAFKHVKLKDVRAPFVQKFLNDILDQGYQRTAEALYYILRSILNYAVNTDAIAKTPMNAVQIPLHQRKNGTALSLDVEKRFIKDIAGTKYELIFVVLLYTGCRPCELSSICFEKPGFLTFRNHKQRNQAIVYKDIPITPMLSPYIERIRSALPLSIPSRLGEMFKDLVPENKLYDLRHTFATRCQTCGVSQALVGRWLGHKSDKITDDVYTHFPQNFVLEEAKKVVY